MAEPDPNDPASRAGAEIGAARPPTTAGAMRRLGQGLLQARLFGAPLPNLGRFEVRRKIGEGGMGAVFEAFDPTLGRVVALKVLRDAGPAMASADVLHEARMLARLSHPHVVTIYELGIEEGEPYVCMERVDGPNLGAWLRAHPEEGWRRRVGLLRGAAAGLAAAHKAGVIHRDFKLENVLIGADGVARVTDFGLARADQPGPGDELGPRTPTPHAGQPPPIDAPAVSTSSGLAGTPGYLAPELVAGGRANEKSDQYSFFVALRVALSPETLSEVPALTALLVQGTDPDPRRRLADMGAVGAALDGLLVHRVAPDQRAREVLLERVQRLWVEPMRGQARLSTLSGAAQPGALLPLRAEPAPELGPTGPPLDLGEGEAHHIAASLRRMLAGVVLVGPPGAGKTVRLLGVAESLQATAWEDPDCPLPVVLNLSSFPAFRGTFGEWLVHELVAKYALPREQALRWLEAGQLALLLDGLDEVEAAARGRCAEAFNAHRRQRPTPFLVTCREENYRALQPKLEGEAVLRLCPLDPETLSRTLRSAAPRSSAGALAGADPALAEQLRNPLLLTLFTQLSAEAEGALGEPSGRPEALRDRLYSLALDHALNREPALQGADRLRAVEGLHWLAAAASRAGVTELWLEELQAAWLPRRRERALALGLGLGGAYAFSIGVNLLAAKVAFQPWYSGLFFGIMAVSAAFIIQGGLRIVPMEAMRWSWPRVRAWIPRNLALGVVTGGLHGLFFDFWADLMLGVATGLLGLSVIGLVPAGRERRVNPGDGLIESLRNSVLVAPLIGLIIGVPVGYLVLPLARPFASMASMYHTHPNPELAWAVTMGTSAAVTSLFITGALAPLMHVALRLTVALCSPLPLRLGPWLDGLAGRGLLHRVGGGWLFRHATFRAWLADARPS